MTRILTPLLAALKNRGVDFRICNNTLPSRHLCPDAVFMEAKVMPSGVAKTRCYWLGRATST